MKGEKVRSKSELLIANALFLKKIPYHYEKPLQLKDGRIVRPDFTIINLQTGEEIYWEHFGLIDDENYRRNMIQKIDAYEREGLIKNARIIFTYEMSSFPLTTQKVDEIISIHFT